MNILIVDDEPEVIAATVRAIDFEALGFANMFTATSVDAARAVFERAQVDLLLTDIEMPGQSGLDLLEWVRDSRRDTVTLFCTAYANFDYAKKALELHSFDYFLKPIVYSELRERIKAAVGEVERLRTERMLRRDSGALASGEERRYAFWHQVISGSESGQEVLRRATDMALDYTMESQFAMIVAFLADENDATEQWRRYAFKNLASEIFTSALVRLESFVLLPSGAWCIVLRTLPAYCEPCFLDDAKRLLTLTHIHLGAWTSLFYSWGATLDSAFDDYRVALDAFTDDVSSRLQVIDACRYVKRALPYSLPMLRDWELLFTAGRCDELVAQINAHIDHACAAGEINMPYLKAMRIDITQMIYTGLKALGVNAHSIFSDEMFEQIRTGSLLSAAHMKRYLEYIIRHGAACINEAEASKSVVGRVKDYIHAHLSEEITRTSMARLVFLNSDYFARLFKKETGQSLGAYLQDCRLQEAKRQLTQTGAQVNEIALNVGYDNFSYFSHIFREKTGMTPNEYRKKNGAEKNADSTE